jgi:hypothetical protein
MSLTEFQDPGVDPLYHQNIALSNITTPECCANFVLVVGGFLVTVARLEDAGSLWEGMNRTAAKNWAAGLQADPLAMAGGLQLGNGAILRIG